MGLIRRGAHTWDVNWQIMHLGSSELIIIYFFVLFFFLNFQFFFLYLKRKFYLNNFNTWWVSFYVNDNTRWRWKVNTQNHILFLLHVDVLVLLLFSYWCLLRIAYDIKPPIDSNLQKWFFYEYILQKRLSGF